MGKLSYTQCNSGSFFYTYASRKSCFLIFHLHSSWRYELNLWIHFLLLFPISMLSSKVIQHCMSPLLVSQLALSLQLVCHTTLLISILKKITQAIRGVPSKFPFGPAFKCDSVLKCCIASDSSYLLKSYIDGYFYFKIVSPIEILPDNNLH